MAHHSDKTPYYDEQYLKNQNQVWKGFTRATTIGASAVVVILALMALFLA